MSTAAAPDAADAPLAIICGGGTLPFAVADAVVQRGRRVVLFALRGVADPARVMRYPHQWGAVGQLGHFIRFAAVERCKDVVFIGSLVRPAFWQVRLDWATLRVLPQIFAAFRGGDDHLLSGVGRIFEQHGFRLLGAHEVAPEILVPEGVLGARAPSAQDRSDIARGIAFLRATGPFDMGQAAVVADNQVLAAEAAEGTDAMLARIAELRANGRIRLPLGRGVLIKAPKPAQDHRFDLPSIGPQTIEGARHAGLAGVAVIAGATIIAEPGQVIAAADRGGMFVLGVSDKSAS
ncbi:MAG TPA: UDP-2,3-diacylglucosamine diphosphatase LpxI [Pseudolabrys sp.]|nr:UDP-2,3-diacylglucosamine diphosphatase LpxI [Pseudolabrys sp.]